MKAGSYLLLALLWALSRLPMRALYVLSDCLFPLVYHLVRYRRGLVRRQLEESFPEKPSRWRGRVERKYYHFLCDYVVETVKLMHMGSGEMERRVTFEGLRELQEEMGRRGKQFALACLGHYGNWEWVASFSLRLEPGFGGAQIYHPLKNPLMDRLFIRIRRQFGGDCIAMRDTLRHVLAAGKGGKREVIGFIADQCPKWEAMHHWTEFLHHQTSFLTGVEQISKRVNSCVVYVHVTRPCRGRYHCRIVPLAWDPRDHKDYEITDLYASALEGQIRERPELWLWTHRRWKRTREEWLARSMARAKAGRNHTEDNK